MTIATSPPADATPKGDGRVPAEEHQRARIIVLDGLRALSIALVLAAHLLPLGPKPFQMNPAAGAMGMSLFFVLSGFLIIRTMAATDVPAFLARRLARLVPLAWFYLVLVWLLHPLSHEGLAAGLTFQLNYWPELMLPQTEHLWSLAVEMHFYLAIALAALVHRRAVWLVWPACFAVTVWRALEGAHLSIATHLRIDEILAGACVGLISSAWLRSRSARTTGWWLCAGAWAVCCHPETGALQFLRPYAAALLLVLTLRLPACPLKAALCSAPARYVASISYALYVIHPLMAHGWWNAGTLTERYLFKRPVGFLITLVLAHLSTQFWEARCIAAARRWEMARKLRHGALNATGRSATVADAPARVAPAAHRPVAE